MRFKFKNIDFRNFIENIFLKKKVEELDISVKNKEKYKLHSINDEILSFTES